MRNVDSPVFSSTSEGKQASEKNLTETPDVAKAANSVKTLEVTVAKPTSQVIASSMQIDKQLEVSC